MNFADSDVPTPPSPETDPSVESSASPTAAPAEPALPLQEPAEPECRHAARLQWVLFALLIVASLVPVWWFRYFPSTDGPAHVANADVILHYYKHDVSVYPAYYQMNRHPLPNAAGHVFLAALLLVVPPLLAEKIFLSVYVILLPLSAAYALRGINRRAMFLAFLIFPLMFSYAFHQGFYNFCLSTAVFFLLIGYWARHREQLTLGRAVAVTGIGILLYACHIFSFMMACAVIGMMAGWFTLADVVNGIRAKRLDWKAVWRGFQSRGLVAFYALLPALILAIDFTLNHKTSGPRTGPPGWKLKSMWMNLLSLNVLSSYSHAEKWFGLATAALLGVLALYAVIVKVGKRQFGAWDASIFAAAAYAVLYFKYSDPTSVSYYLPVRLMLFVCFGLLLFLAAQTYASWIRAIAIAASIAIAAGMGVLHWIDYARYNTQIAEYVSLKKHIQPNSTLLPLLFSPRGYPQSANECDPSAAPFYMVAGYITAEKHVVDLRNYEAHTDYFPVRFKAERDPYEHLSARPQGLADESVLLDLAGYEKKTGGRIDYVIGWAVTPQMPQRAATFAKLLNNRLIAPAWMTTSLGDVTQTDSLFKQLDKGYDLIAKSDGRGAAWLWKHK